MNRIILFLLLVIGGSAVAQKADDIIGEYHLKNKLDVRIFVKNNKYFGKIISLNGYNNNRIYDINNPNKEKRNDSLLGKVIIDNLEYNSNTNKWINGRIYAPEKGMYLNLKITETFEGGIEIVGSKYFFWKTMRWKRL
ncbi:MAG: DUF2147 domain-containing protein [Bacteroidota bacterium]|nr:DUF2147 domain-containing protein [Bacteroidota bacterium]